MSTKSKTISDRRKKKSNFSAKLVSKKKSGKSLHSSDDISDSGVPQYSPGSKNRFSRPAVKFISVSDDRTVRLWELGCSITIHELQDPTIPPLSSLCLHPTEDIFLAQSSTFEIYSLFFCRKSDGSFSFARGGRSFVDPISFGLASKVDISPDGQYVISGTARGDLCIWDYYEPKGTAIKPIKKVGLLKNSISINVCSWSNSGIIVGAANGNILATFV
eukprot:gnl/Carplike_NY0171/15130_a22546_119.p1 GENE.gnl/Carplike_NY0171/15130_a22546_119~~gnl/Carplike_NY0171/15130_a22546_119.p1  ORF type:complete len:242 (+),score=31.88 gnl/Carplike_NY0171/15130_a22546_119:73-726(+)